MPRSVSAQGEHDVGCLPTRVVQVPDDHNIDLAALSGIHQRLAPGPVLRPRADVLDPTREIPATVPGLVRRHRPDVQADGLLIVDEDLGEESPAHGGSALSGQPSRPRPSIVSSER
jgi:hypothetical protein